MEKYFFVGIGGSGMMPLALILKQSGHEVFGSDRSFDQGKIAEKFEWLKAQGINLKPQDGSGIEKGMILVISSAVEKTIPDVARAIELGIKIMKRAELLSSLFNKAETRIGIAGTSGKSTTTGMMGYALKNLEKSPTMVNGAVVRDFVTDKNPYASFLGGNKNLFVAEIDESDGTIELYNPTHAFINNIALDHKPLHELLLLFQNYAQRAGRVILPFNAEYMDEIINIIPQEKLCFWHYEEDRKLEIPQNCLTAKNVSLGQDCLSAEIIFENQKAALNLSCGGEHNLKNALAVLRCLVALGFSLTDCCQALSGFQGIQRRMELVGVKNNIRVYDDFAHNPDKIKATLKTLNLHEGRLLIFFQMHGFAPLKLMRQELLDMLQKYLKKEDILYVPEVLYLGGTVEKNYTAKNFIDELKPLHHNSYWFEKREEIKEEILKHVKPADRIIIMGARDDTLSFFAKDIFENL